MRITIGQLRRLVRGVLRESGGGWASPPQPAGSSSMLGSDIVNREQIGRLESGTPEDDDLPEHLRDPQEDPEDCFGPVPPTNVEPYLTQDPYTRDTSPLQTSPIKR